MKQIHIDFFNKHYGYLGDINNWTGDDVVCDGVTYHDAKIFGDIECFCNCGQFYQYMVCDDKMYRAYYHIPDSCFGVEDIDYTRPYYVEEFEVDDDMI